MTDTNWVTGEASLWLDNDEYAYHQSRAIVKSDRISMADELRALVLSVVPDAGSFTIVQQINDVDWGDVIARIRDDIEEGYE